MAHRMEKIRDLRWEAGPVLPDRINQEILTVKEKEYFTKYNSILTDYIENVGFDVTADLEVRMWLNIYHCVIALN